MPIRGLIRNEPGQGLPEVARLYKGGKQREYVKNGKTIRIVGEDLPYFRVQFAEGYEWLRGIWEELYGVEPQQFSGVSLMGATAENAFPCWYEEWRTTSAGNQKLIRRCDGEQQVKYLQQDVYCAAPAPCLRSTETPCSCQMKGRLRLVLHDLMQASGVVGYVHLAIHSEIEMRAILAALCDYERLFGSLSTSRFTVGRRQMTLQIQKPDGRPGEKIARTYSLVYVELDPAFTRLQLAGQTLYPAQARVLPQAHPQAHPQALPPGMPPAVLPPVRPDAEVTWTTRTQDVTNFFKWCKALGMSQVDVFDALSEASVEPVRSLRDWHGSQEHAMAAVLAAHCDYDLAEIAALTSGNLLELPEDQRYRLYELAQQLLQAPDDTDIEKDGAEHDD